MMPEISHIRLLLIEDNPGDARLLQEIFQKSQYPVFRLLWARSLTNGLEILSAESFDLVILDLHLPDSLGRHTFTHLHQRFPLLPVIIISGTQDEALATQTVRDGAQDYFLKGQFNEDILKRAIHYAIERQRLLNELESARQREQEVREIHALEQLSQLTKTNVTAQMFGIPPLRESAPDVFNLLVKKYQALMDDALDHRVYRVEQDLSKNLRVLADQLGVLRAGPRDVVDLHTVALKDKNKQASLQKAQIYVEEGRLMVLELMGYLVTFYRTHAVFNSSLGEV